MLTTSHAPDSNHRAQSTSGGPITHVARKLPQCRRWSSLRAILHIYLLTRRVPESRSGETLRRLLTLPDAWTFYNVPGTRLNTCSDGTLQGRTCAVGQHNPHRKWCEGGGEEHQLWSPCSAQSWPCDLTLI